MKELIRKMAFKYRNNIIAKILVRPFYRMKVNSDFNKRRQLYLLNASNLLFQLKRSLDECNILFWLDFGTLLGAYREHDFIKHDLDLDIGVFYEDAGKVKDALLKNGFRIIREFRVNSDVYRGLEHTYLYYGVTVDIFYYHRRGEQMFCNTFSPFDDEYEDMSIYQVKEIILPYNGFDKISFKGAEFIIPAKTDLHLAAHYGKNFMIPNAHFDYRKEATNIHWFSRNEYVGILKSY